jgi:hypothetical protein
MRAEGCGEDAGELARDARGQHVRVVAGVEQAAGDDADEVCQQHLLRADPGDTYRAEAELLRVVGLEDAERKQEAEGVEVNEMAIKGL